MGDTPERYVRFRVGTTACALPVANVLRVIPVQPLTRVPRLPDHVLGITNMRGRILPIVDLGRRLGGASSREGTKPRIVVAELDDLIVGYLVSSVTGSADFARSQMKDAPRMDGPVPLELIEGIVTTEAGEVTAILSLPQLIETDREQLAS